MNQTVKLAAIGVGGIWQVHVRNLTLLGGNEVIAACDLVEDNRNRAAEQLGARTYSNIEAMFEAEPDIQAVISCTPPIARRAVIEAAIKRGIPALVEKPPAFTEEEAAAIVQLTRLSGAPVFVGFMYRFLPIVTRMRELLGDRTVNLVQSHFFCPLATKWNMPGWFHLKDRSGGHILDQAIHSLDLIRFFMGDVTEVFTVGTNVICPKNAEFTIEDSSSTTLRFASGASGVHVHSWAHDEFVVGLTLVGSDFKLQLDLDERLTGFIGDRQINETMPAMPTDSTGASHHLEEMRAFLNAVRSNDFSGMHSPYADAAKSLATVAAMNRSIESGQPEKVRLDF